MKETARESLTDALQEGARSGVGFWLLVVVALFLAATIYMLHLHLDYMETELAHKNAMIRKVALPLVENQPQRADMKDATELRGILERIQDRLDRIEKKVNAIPDSGRRESAIEQTLYG